MFWVIGSSYTTQLEKYVKKYCYYAVDYCLSKPYKPSSLCYYGKIIMMPGVY